MAHRGVIHGFLSAPSGHWLCYILGVLLFHIGRSVARRWVNVVTVAYALLAECAYLELAQLSRVQLLGLFRATRQHQRRHSITLLVFVAHDLQFAMPDTSYSSEQRHRL